jgi:2-amino-4-hydroxy-6-hydroxymethyldihydropteridine diphosphokinase
LSGQNKLETRAWLGLGGNLGDPRAAMATALQGLDASDRVRVVAVSSLYSTPPWGRPDQPDFVNAVAEVATSLDARGLLDLCLETERSLKRVRAERWGPRLIDMDVLVFGNERIDEDGLVVPHPRMAERAFVMVPLAEISAELDVQGRPAAAVAAGLDRAGIEPIAPPSWWR